MSDNTWIKPGAKIILAKYNPFRLLPVSDVLASATEATIEKVGSKYFYIDGASFDKNTGRSTGNMSYGTRAYKDRDHIVETYEVMTMRRQIEANMDKATPEQVKAIHAIMFPNKDK